MTEQDQNEDFPKLDALARQYRETRAPLGFAARVAAHVDPKHRTSMWSDIVVMITGSPKLLVSVSVAIMALLSVLVVQSVFERQPDLQIAEQDDIQQPVTHGEQTVQQAQKPAVKKEIDPAFYQPATNGGYANLAALSDVSVWLDEDTESSTSAVPDMTDIPDLGDIETMFDTT